MEPLDCTVVKDAKTNKKKVLLLCDPDKSVFNGYLLNNNGDRYPLINRPNVLMNGSKAK